MNDILRTLLYEWRDRLLPDLLPRDIKLDIARQVGVNNATVIAGFRRVGKTYLVFAAIKELLLTLDKDDVVYINFEDERLSPTIDTLSELLPSILATYGKKPRYLFLDEIQIIPGWGQWVRRILDTEQIQIFVTGSSSKMGTHEIPTELRGRVWLKHVSPLSFSEFLRFKNVEIDSKKSPFILEEQAKLSYLLDEYLKYGALPAVVLVDQSKKQELLQAYFQTVVSKEIGERYKVSNDVMLKNLLKLLINSSLITISKLHNTLKSMGIGVGKETIANYLGYIENSYFMKQLYIYNPSVVNQLNYARKVYFIDTGFITALSTKFSPNLGRLLENAVYNHLSRVHETVHYYRDSNDNEVDFISMEDNKASALYQVCYDAADPATLDRELRSLTKAGTYLKCKNLYLVVAGSASGVAVPNSVKVVSAQELLG